MVICPNQMDPNGCFPLHSVNNCKHVRVFRWNGHYLHTPQIEQTSFQLDTYRQKWWIIPYVQKIPNAYA